MCDQLYKNPKCLPCHHSYCEACLEKKQLESKIICPECEAESAVPIGGVKDLPINFFINSIMDKLGLKRKGDDEVLKCNECVENDPIVAYCPKCSSYLCRFCWENHKRSKRFHDHNTFTVNELKSIKSITIQPNTLSPTCKEHDIELLSCCESCEQLVCKYCVVKNHMQYGCGCAKVRIEAYKDQFALEAIGSVEKVGKNPSEAHDVIDEMRKVRLCELLLHR